MPVSKEEGGAKLDGATEPSPPTVVGKKATQTRLRILNAGMLVLVEKGYGGFSASAVAERTGLSRMAMLYHFPTLQALLSALVHHVAQLRIDAFVSAIRSVPMVESYKGQAYRAAVADLAWKQVHTPEFAAFTELTTAARTDPVLAEIIHPAIVAFDRSRRRVAEALFPAGSVDGHDFQLARDVVRFLAEGVGNGTTIIENRAERLARMQHFTQMLVATTAGNAFLEQVSADWQRRHGTGNSHDPAADRPATDG